MLRSNRYGIAVGAALVVAPLSLLATTTRSTPRPAAVSPARATAAAAPSPVARWSAADAASVLLLRYVVIAEAQHVIPALAHCEARGRATANAVRGRTYVRCALRPLARVGSSGTLNSRMLFRIGGGNRPGPRCQLLIRSLAGAAAVLGMLARATLREEISAQTPWPDTSRASRAIRSLASDNLRLAHARAWRQACQPGADQPPTASLPTT
jgi:hypothetical protein